jgi:predicted DNA-binding antitoxin AbrB/MazE fold protein
MTITIEAVYEGGVLKPSQPLPFKEHEQLQVTVAPIEPIVESPSDIVQQMYGIVKWSGTHEELERILAEIENDEDAA